MIDPQLVKLFAITLGSGVAGSILGGLVGYLSGDPRLRLENATGVGFLIGAAVGATIGVFTSIAGRL